MFLAGNWLLKASYNNFGHISTSGAAGIYNNFGHISTSGAAADLPTRNTGLGRSRGLPTRNHRTRSGRTYRRGTQEQERQRSTDAEPQNQERQDRNRRGRGLPTRNHRTRSGKTGTGEAEVYRRGTTEPGAAGPTDAE